MGFVSRALQTSGSNSSCPQQLEQCLLGPHQISTGSLHFLNIVFQAILYMVNWSSVPDNDSEQ